jgi:hypothetical protein
MKKQLYIFFILLPLLSAMPGAQQRSLRRDTSPAAQRVALVIGNSAYETAPLRNSVNDASDMAQALRDLGFDVIHKENVNQNEMKRAVRAFGAKIQQSSVALFYYAGHGIQVNGQNYLLPIGATIDKQEEVEYEGVDVGFVLAQMEDAGGQTKIVILDACRNNPFARSFRSATRGLASMNAPSGTLIAYATAPGTVASDGNARNGVYTQELLKNVRIPGLDVEEVFKRVRIAVREQTKGKQTPWESSSLVGNFYFINITISNVPRDSNSTASSATRKILFEEHFDNNSRQWLESSSDERRLAITDGHYVIESKVENASWFATRPVAITQTEDFKIECTARKIEGVNNFGYGLLWGVKDRDNLYYLSIMGNGKFTVTKKQAGKLIRIIPWSIPNSINKFNSTNKLSFEKKGDQMMFYINDLFVGKVPFEPLFGNGIGFIVSNKQTIAFDDIIVTVKNK